MLWIACSSIPLHGELRHIIDFTPCHSLHLMVSCASSCTLIFTILPFIFLALSLSLRQKSSGPERGSNTGCMFGTQQEVGTNLIKFRLTQTCPDASPKVLKIQEVLNLWQENTQFVDFFNQVISRVSYPRARESIWR